MVHYIIADLNPKFFLQDICSGELAFRVKNEQAAATTENEVYRLYWEEVCFNKVAFPSNLTTPVGAEVVVGILNPDQEETLDFSTAQINTALPCRPGIIINEINL